MKKRILLIIPFLLPLCSCGGTSQYLDSDFDGLYDSIDPNKDSNQYKFAITSPDGETQYQEDLLTIDFRNIVFNDKPTYNKDVAKMSAAMALEAYGDKEKLEIRNDKYVSKDSDVFPLLAQFGFKDVRYYEGVTSAIDENDKCGLFIGNHIVEIDNKLTQVVGAVIKGYIGSTGWLSNIDFGADTDSYYEVTGNHPDWENKKYHKGFDVSANRIYTSLISYFNEFKINNGDNMIYICGQSRGGAITNLLAKKLQDNNIKNVAYCINPPTNTTEEDETIIKSYTNIFNLVCDEDIVRRFPLVEWDFKTYGTSFHYSFVENKSKFEEYFGYEFQYLSSSLQEELFTLLRKWVYLREDMYEFRKPSEEYKEYETFVLRERALEYKEDLDNRISSPIGKKSVTTEMYFDDSINRFVVQYYTRPSILTDLIYVIVININQLTPQALLDILEVYSEYRLFLSRYISEIFTLKEFPTSINQINHPHEPKSAILGCEFAK